MKKRFSCILAFVFLFTFIFQACTLPNKPYIKKDASEATPLKAVRYESPSMVAYSSGVLLAIAAGCGVVSGGIGAIIGSVIYYQVCKLPDDPSMPDFGMLVIDKFAERAKVEIPGWPAMFVEKKPVNEVLNDKDNFTLQFKIDSTEIEKSYGLHFVSIATMKDKEGNIVWEKGYLYESKNFDRETDYDILQKDNNKKLKEEIVFAADQTVKDFIEHFKNPQAEPQLQVQN